MSAKNSQLSKISGFTLIEVLIALAILSASFTAIFQMFHQSEMSSRKVSEIYSRTMTERSLLAEMSIINPAKSGSGTSNLGQISYRWNAVPLSPLMPVRSEDGNSQRHIQLYRVDITYKTPKKNQTGSFSFEKLGWETKLN